MKWKNNPGQRYALRLIIFSLDKENIKKQKKKSTRENKSWESREKRYHITEKAESKILDYLIKEGIYLFFFPIP